MLGSPRRSAVLSVFIHALAIVLILTLAASKHSLLTQLLPLHETPVYSPVRVHVKGLGGGGGQNSPLPPSKGQPPKAAPRVFVPPIIRVEETRAAIEMPPAVLAAVDTQIQSLNLPMGSLTGVSGPPSGGPGTGGGLGSGKGPGVGDGAGPGVGDGPGGGGINGLQGKKVTQPVLLARKDPEYSEEARKAKFQGTVQLSIVVNASGQVTNINVLRGAGLGLDERAVEAVRQWKFRAGMVDGKAVAMRATVEVNFRLL
jgi:periplasmic protein TonB